MIYNRVSMKASHNSYQSDEGIREQINWYPKADYNCNCGCGAIELDIAQADGGMEWSVGHKEAFDKEYRKLSLFLMDLKRWSDDNPNHDVITVYLDLKHVANKEAFPDELDYYISEYIPTNIIFTPSELMDSTNKLKNKWPEIEELKGHLIFCLTGNDDKELYATTSPEQRLCFADKDESCDQAPQVDNIRVFFNYNINHDNREKWMDIFENYAGTSNIVIRAYVADSEDNWNDCLDSGCNLIATDNISGYDWAKVGESRFVAIQKKGC